MHVIRGSHGNLGAVGFQGYVLETIMLQTKNCQTPQDTLEDSILCEWQLEIFTGNMFFCMLGRLSSCDHLHRGNWAAERKCKANMTGSDLNCNKVRLYIFTLLCILMHWCWTSYLSLTTYSTPYLISFLSIRSRVISKGLSGGDPTICPSLILYPHHFPLFPVCSAAGMETELPVRAKKKAAATGPQRFLHNDLIFSSSNRTRSIVRAAYFAFFFRLVYTMRGSCAFSLLRLLLNTVFGSGRKAGALPLCCLLQWSARRIWLSSERAFCAEIKKKKSSMLEMEYDFWRSFFFFPFDPTRDLDIVSSFIAFRESTLNA